MNELISASAGHLVGLALTAVVVSPIGLSAYFASLLIFFLSYGGTCVIAYSYSDATNINRPNLVHAAIGCALLASGMVTGSLVGMAISCLVVYIALKVSTQL